MNRTACIVALLCSGVLLLETPPAASAASSAKPVECTLNIKGHSIVSLTLVRQGDASVNPQDGISVNPQDGISGQRHLRPGKTLRLAAGRYRVEHVELEGDYQLRPHYGHDDDWLELAPGQPNELVVGAPLRPTVTAKRHGRFLQLDYDLVDAAQRSYSKTSNDGNQRSRPRFTVYKGDEVLGSESFEYG